MKRKNGNRVLLAAAAAGVAMAMPACDSADDLVMAQELMPVVIQAMERGIQDEYHAENIYLKVVDDFGSVRPFSNIVRAEQRHSTSLGLMFTRYGLDIPASQWNLGNVPTFASVSAACAAATDAELRNIGMYDEILALELPADVRTVFENNRRASLENHLPAFERCR